MCWDVSARDGWSGFASLSPIKTRTDRGPKFMPLMVRITGSDAFRGQFAVVVPDVVAHP